MKYVFLAFFSITFFSCKSIVHPPKKTFEKNIVKQPFDAIIVPGVPFKGKEWDPVMQIRVQWAKMLVDSGYTKNVIFSGGAVYTPYVESEVMAEYAKKMGVPEEIILTESEAEHSTENVYNCYRMAKNNGFKNIALATDQYQLKNMRSFIQKFDLPISLLPIVFSKLTATERINPKNVDCEHTRVENFVSIKDRENLPTRLKGTFGQQIIWYEEDVKKEKLRRKLAKQGRLIPTPE